MACSACSSGLRHQALARPMVKDLADDLADDPRRLSTSEDEISNQDDECMKESHRRVVGGAAVGAAALAGAVT